MSTEQQDVVSQDNQILSWQDIDFEVSLAMGASTAQDVAAAFMYRSDVAARALGKR